MVQERYQDIILTRMETFYSSTGISTLLVFEFLTSFLNVCIFTDYVKTNTVLFIYLFIYLFIIIIIIIIIIIMLL